jgi:hypothetical protein
VHKSKRSHSVSKPARDPRDEASPPRSSTDLTGTRSPSPVIDFDGLSRPSMSLPSPLKSQLINSRPRDSRTQRRNPRTGRSTLAETLWRGENDPRMHWRRPGP